ncbi:family 78 glycoside hydrolase catalytic domain [uncultured Cyclobacterium sp.]|uniref:family 78 glycoside hydrolase catalytic domain n=1 Tax=uncultured Cyclobacterium sp. TaxID=453820 RepID=UPI0030EC3460|tara:strand:+ start:129153 stop:132011 length:2859 start_codon:yes stop_codon:yes gene_type:complete
MKISTFLVLFSLILSSKAMAISDLTPEYLRCEYLENPFIDEREPRLSWVLASEVRNQHQTAYRILVASKMELLEPGKADLWDSNKISGDQTNQVVYKGKALVSRQKCYWKVQSWDKKDQPGKWSEASTWEMGLLMASDWKSKWIGKDFSSNTLPIPYKNKELLLPPSPILRNKINLTKKVSKARLYITSLGLYEYRIDGEKVGLDFLAPGWTDYDKRVYYNVYDVTDRLDQGEHVLQAILSPGWYSGYIGYALLIGNPVVRAFYGDTPALRAQLEVTYSDGKTATFSSNEEWKAASGGLVESDILHGETFDARKVPEDWSKTNFNDNNWSNAEIISAGNRNLELYPAQPVQVTEIIKPVDIYERENGKFIFNMGQNFAGLVKLKVKGKAGDKVVLRFGEMLHPDGRLMDENLRMARATDTYILNGDPNGEEWTPSFTYHGFQYVEVTGFPEKPKKESITGLVLGSNTPRVGHFETDHPMVNQLYKNIVWTQRANFVDIPTDCPQRDERMGWTGDAQTYAGTAAINMDVSAFFTKWIQDLNDAQWDYGAYPDYAPAPGVRISDTYAPGWMEAGVINPYEQYRAYGDTRIIEKGWENMERFMAFHDKKSKGTFFYPEGSFADLSPKGGYGDWLSIGKKTPPDMLATMYYGYVSQLMSEMATAIGKSGRAMHYQNLSKKIKSAFAEHYMDKESVRLITNAAAYGDGKGYVDGQMGFSGHTQTAYANAISLDFLNEEQKKKAGAHLAQLIYENDGKLATGFLGAKQLLPALTATGHSDLAYQLLLNEEYPSWGFEIKNGATTIWERWDSYVKDDPEKMASLNNGMNSFSHYAFGSVFEWMFNTMAGIRAEEPAYKTFIIAPEIPQNAINYVAASHQSIHGKITSSWKKEKGKLLMEVSIPVNTQATVYIPAKNELEVTLDDIRLDQHQDIQLGHFYKGKQAVKLGSGTYHFTSHID